VTAHADAARRKKLAVGPGAEHGDAFPAPRRNIRRAVRRDGDSVGIVFGRQPLDDRGRVRVNDRERVADVLGDVKKLPVA
jgi:hypothetical protein